VSTADILFGQVAPTTASFQNEIIGLITLLRVAVNTLFLPLILGVAALAGVQLNDPRLPFLLIVGWLISASGNIVNDIVDRKRDKTKWPLRPLSTGLVSNSVAAIYTSLITAIAFIMAGLIFSWLFAALVLAVLISSYVYDRYLRDRIGYLTIMLSAALIAIVIWTAFSPDTIATPLFWLAVMLSAVTFAVINVVNEAFDPKAKPLLIRPTPLAEMLLYVLLVIAMFFLGIAAFVYEMLPWPYLLALIAVTVWGLTAARYLGGQRSFEDLKKAFAIMATWLPTYWLSIAVSLLVK
jgi:4-hydroxybenzoate polyprenyltransferase